MLHERNMHSTIACMRKTNLSLDQVQEGARAKTATDLVRAVVVVVVVAVAGNSSWMLRGETPSASREPTAAVAVAVAVAVFLFFGYPRSRLGPYATMDCAP